MPRWLAERGTGFSVAEVLAAAEKVTGRTIPRRYGARREGDPPALVADSKRARSELGWTPRFHALETIIEHAWAWERKVAGGATPFSGSRTAR